MVQYFVIGGDGAEYGPSSWEQITAWIGEGRLDSRSVARRSDSSQRVPLGALPEFHPALMARWGSEGLEIVVPPQAPPMPQGARPPMGQTALTPTNESAVPGRLDAVECVSVAFSRFGENAGLMIGATFLIALAMLLSWIPSYLIAEALEAEKLKLADNLVLMMGGVVLPTLMGVLASSSMLRMSCRVARGEAASLADLFVFRRPLDVILFGVACIAAIVVLVSLLMVACFEAIGAGSMNSQRAFFGLIGLILVGVLVIAIYCVFIIQYMLGVALIVDRNMTWIEAIAMTLSGASRNLTSTLALAFFVMVLNLIGSLTCGVASLITGPVTALAICVASDQMFGNAPRR